MEILVTNDDGFMALGIKTLAKALRPYGNVTIVAPDRCRSAVSHGLLLYSGLEFKEEESVDGIPCYSSSGLPADCVRLATSILKKNFDIVFSGINHGINVGTDVTYSGTVAAAKEAIIEGIPGVAVSADINTEEMVNAEIDKLIKYIFDNKLYSKDYVLNVNFPVNQFKDIKGYKLCKQGIKSFKTEFIKTNKGDYDKLSDTITYDLDPNTDVNWGLNGYLTFTPIGVDQTYYKGLDILKNKMEV